MRRRPAVPLVAVVLLACTASASAATPSPPRKFARGSASPSLRSLVTALGGRAGNAAAERYAYLRKLDSHLQNIGTARLTGRSVAAAAAREGALVTSDGDVRVDVYVNGGVGAAAAQLRALGMRVEATSDSQPERMVEGLLPVSRLTAAAGLAATHAVLAVYSGTNVGAKTSEGDAAIDGPQARTLGSTTGAGVPVGVISDSINKISGGIGASQSTGDLPGPSSSPPGQVTALAEDPGGEDEGRAMAEIMFDEAPGIRNMFFSTGTLGAAVKAQSIQNLVAQGVKVIADDTFDPTEPYFQDGVVAQSVDAAKAAGVAYFVSAGNRARQSWEGNYAPVADPTLASPTTNDFGGGDTIQTIGTFPGGTQMYVALQWDEPFGQASTDLAIDVYDIVSGTPHFDFTVDTDNLASGIPEEFASITTGSNPIGIAIRRKAGTRNPFMKYIVGGTPTFTIAEHATNSDAIDPDAASSNGAVTVAASHYPTPATPESFSSRGPVERLFNTTTGARLTTPDVRQKPQVAGPDGVSTTVPVTGLSTFFGTSAASPAVAGIATLLRSVNPTMPVDEVYAILTNPANDVDCTVTAGVPDPDCGFGFSMANTAMQQALDTSPPVIGASVSPATPNGANGWYTAPPSVSWNVSDAQSPVVDPSGCGATTVTTEGAHPITCTATSAGGTGNGSVTIKFDSTPPTGVHFTGISAKHFSPSSLPAASRVKCTATDTGSGVDGCVVSGFRKSAGKHKLTGTARNDAGLTGTGSLTYTVNSIGGLKLPKRFSLGSLFSSGLPISVTVASKNTTISAKLTASVSGASGARTLVLGSFRKKAKKPGKFKFRLKVNSAGRRALQSGKVSKIKLAVTGKAGGNATTVKRTFKLRH
jgi:hypothetical protein